MKIHPNGLIPGYLMVETEKEYRCVCRMAAPKESWDEQMGILEATGLYERVFMTQEVE